MEKCERHFEFRANPKTLKSHRSFLLRSFTMIPFCGIERLSSVFCYAIIITVDIYFAEGGYYHVPVLHTHDIDKLFHFALFELNCPFFTDHSFRCTLNFCIYIDREGAKQFKSTSSIRTNKCTSLSHSLALHILPFEKQNTFLADPLFEHFMDVIMAIQVFLI